MPSSIRSFEAIRDIEPKKTTVSSPMRMTLLVESDTVHGVNAAVGLTTAGKRL